MPPPFTSTSLHTQLTPLTEIHVSDESVKPVGVLTSAVRGGLVAASPSMGLERFDYYSSNKAHDDLKVRTLGGAGISIVCCIIALLLFISEFRTWRSLETVDILDVDTTARPDGKLPINIDIYLPSLPCGELITEVTDESGSQQLSVTDTLQKMRMDRHGVPIDLPERIEWEHVVAPAFQQRKVVGLMEEAHQHLKETLGHLEHEEEENPGLSADEHSAHRAQLAEQAAQLHGRLSQLTEVAHANEEGDHDAHLEISAKELHAMHEEVEQSRLYTDSQRQRVLSNLHAMAKNVARLRNGSHTATAGNLREALRIRLSILSDNVHGFISAADIDRRDRYQSMQVWTAHPRSSLLVNTPSLLACLCTPSLLSSPLGSAESLKLGPAPLLRPCCEHVQELLNDVTNETALLPALVRQHVEETLTGLADSLARLNKGLGGQARRDLEHKFDQQVRSSSLLCCRLTRLCPRLPSPRLPSPRMVASRARCGRWRCSRQSCVATTSSRPITAARAMGPVPTPRRAATHASSSRMRTRSAGGGSLTPPTLSRSAHLSPRISPHLPASPRISPHLPASPCSSRASRAFSHLASPHLSPSLTSSLAFSHHPLCHLLSPPLLLSHLL